MSRVKITDDNVSVEIESENKPTSELFNWARKAIDLRNSTGLWMPAPKTDEDTAE